MSDDRVTMTEAERANLDRIARHRDLYLESGGREGHIWDFSWLGGFPFTPTLLLETLGRKSGEPRIVPLIYGATHGEVLVIASKGGADVHPAWYFNMAAAEEVTIQIATQAFRARWREPQGEERERMWSYMASVYPPYTDYQKSTKRRIPLICFKPQAPADVLKP